MGLNKRLISTESGPDLGLIFNLDAQASGSAVDQTGNKTSFTTNTATYVSASPSYWDFNGGQYMLTNTSGPGFNRNSLYSVELWVRPDAVNVDETFLNIYSNAYNAARFGLRSTSQWMKDEYLPSGGNGYGGTPTANVWQHVTWVRSANNTSNGFKVYKNGTLNASVQSENTGPDKFDRYYIGQIYNNGQRYNGRIGHVKIYTTALTAEQVLGEYNNTKSDYGL